MKRNDLQEAKKLDTKALLLKVATLKGEIADLTMDKHMDKLKDKKTIDKKRKEVAQYLTIARQKDLLAEFDKATSAPEEKSEEEKVEKKTKKGETK